MRGSRGPQHGYYHLPCLAAKGTLGTRLCWHPVVAGAVSEVGWLAGHFGQQRPYWPFPQQPWGRQGGEEEIAPWSWGPQEGSLGLMLSAFPVGTWEGSGGADGGVSYKVRSEGLEAQGVPVRPFLGQEQSRLFP